MALTHCPECNKEISDKAETCPQCGVRLAPPPPPEFGLGLTKGGVIFLAIVGVGGLILLKCFR